MAKVPRCLDPNTNHKDLKVSEEFNAKRDRTRGVPVAISTMRTIKKS